MDHVIIWPHCDMFYFPPISAREAAIWELEEWQLREKHQLSKKQLKDLFFLKRHQMHTRHEKVGGGWYLLLYNKTCMKKPLNGVVL